jgi:hypothetical protein
MPHYSRRAKKIAPGRDDRMKNERPTLGHVRKTDPNSGGAQSPADDREGGNRGGSRPGHQIPLFFKTYDNRVRDEDRSIRNKLEASITLTAAATSASLATSLAARIGNSRWRRAK